MKKYNISTLLILPLFNKFAKTLYTANNNQHNIFSLLFDRGLVKAYLFTEGEELLKDSYTLKLLFKKGLVSKAIDNTNNHHNLLDILVHHKFITNYKNLNKHILIELIIPEKYSPDVKKIINSNYSEVSKEYKECVSMSGMNVIPTDETNLFMLVNNLPLSIVNKSNKLVTYINQIYKTNINKEEIKELLPIFDLKKETYENNNS